MVRKKDDIFLMLDNCFVAEQLSFFSDLETIPSHVIDKIVSGGTGEMKTPLLIHFVYQKENDPERRVNYLKKIYRVSHSKKTGYGMGYHIDNADYAVWFNSEGLHVVSGRRACYTSKGEMIPWKHVDEILTKMIAGGNYIAKEKILKARNVFEDELSKSLCYMFQDLSSEAESKFLPLLRKTRLDSQNYDGFREVIFDLVQNPKTLNSLICEMAEFAEAFQSNQKLMRFTFYRPDWELWKLQLLEKESNNFEMKERVDLCGPSFISDDEILAHIIPPTNIDRKYDVYSNFVSNKSTAECAKYLQHIMGNNSGGHCGLENYQCNTKGLVIEKSYLLKSYAKESFSWTQLASLVSSVVTQDCFFTDEDAAQYGDYVKAKLARSLYFFFFNYENRHHPEYIAEYSTEESLRTLIDKKMACSQLLKVLEETLLNMDTERHWYNRCKKTANDLKAYLQGNYLNVAGLPAIRPVA